MLTPKPRKFRKWNNKVIRNTFENKSNKIKFGLFAIQAIEKNLLTAKQIEAVRRTITGLLKKRVKIWIRAYPDFPITAKPKEVRMGRGKGNVDFWACMIKPGRIIFEISSKDKNLIKNTLIFAKRKLPFATRIITRETLL